MKPTLPIATAFALWMTAASADPFNDAIVANLQDLGYDYIEIKTGISQVKVEAIRGTDKLEVIYDRETGEILKQEREQAEAGEVGRTGVEIDRRNRDFLDDDDIDGRDDDDDDDDDDHSGRDHDDDDDDHDEDDDDDDSDDDSDDDDDDDDDDNSGRG